MYNDIIKFLKKAQNLKSFKRHNWTTDGERESIAAHTWGILILFLVLQSELDFKIDTRKVMELLIVHDLSEAIGGDIPKYRKTEKDSGIEAENLITLVSILPEKSKNKISELILEFEDQITEESRYAKVLDKLESQLQHLFSGSEYWNCQETGKHMLNYPILYLNKLGDRDLKNFWENIRKALEIETKKIKG